MKRVLFDSDVLLDVLAQRQPFVIASARALNTITHKQVQGYVSGHAVTNIYYILRRQIGSEPARELIASKLYQRHTSDFRTTSSKLLEKIKIFKASENLR